jgi:peptidoglycan lytic transglycosylase
VLAAIPSALPIEEALVRLRAAAVLTAMTFPLLAAPADAGVVKKKRLHVRVGRAAVVVGDAPAGVVRLQVRRRGAWRTLDRDRAGGRFVLRDRVRSPMSAPARVIGPGVDVRVGRLNAYRLASASWYGPGLYGNHLACGGTLTPGKLGVANKTLPCGTKLTLRRGTRTVRVRVIDRGPYVAGREFDLTEATARKLHFRGHGAILSTR